uniref:Uncharacterized protein n=1 Tax=Amphora coffeiformis TaxID=265554 RepID=A0A7S3PCV4_9STRA
MDSALSWWVKLNEAFGGGANDVSQLVTACAVAVCALMYSCCCRDEDNGREVFLPLVVLYCKTFLLWIQSSSSSSSSNHDYYLVRIILLRSVAWVYGVSFLVAWRQNKALIGDNGIRPCRRVLEKAQAGAQSA